MSMRPKKANMFANSEGNKENECEICFRGYLRPGFPLRIMPFFLMNTLNGRQGVKP